MERGIQRELVLVWVKHHQHLQRTGWELSLEHFLSKLERYDIHSEYVIGDAAGGTVFKHMLHQFAVDIIRTKSRCLVR